MQPTHETFVLFQLIKYKNSVESSAQNIHCWELQNISKYKLNMQNTMATN